MPKCPGSKLHVDFLARSVACERPLAKPESGEFSFGAWNNFTRLGIQQDAADSMCYAQTAAPEVKKAKRRKMQKRGYCWNKKHYVMKPSGGWWTGRGALSKKPPVLATTTENWQHKALLGQTVTTALGILRFEKCAAKGVPKHSS